MSLASARIKSLSAEDTERVASALAAAIVDGGCDKGPFVVHLAGDLGAGKTTFVRGALRALGVTGHIKSPSYTLLETYAAREYTLIHLDLYRIRDTQELEELALRDYYAANHIWWVEWAEKGAGVLPSADLRVSLELDVQSRYISIESLSDAGRGAANRWSERAASRD
jgi:tRNA threonylcarbamoyladenosine biosynthesis protein TsaE